MQDKTIATAILRKNSGNRRAFWFAQGLVLLLATLVAVGNAQSTNLVVAAIDPANRVALKGHHPAWARAQNDRGAVPADLKLEQLTIVLNRPPAVEKAYTQFLADQQNPKSPNYHHWLTPVETGQRFGVSDHDIEQVTAWLQSQSLTVDAVSNSRVRITFSGTAMNVANAFGSEMHYFQVGSEKRVSITGDPQIPAALKAVVRVVSGLSTVRTYPQHQVKVGTMQMKESSEGERPVPEGTLSDGSHVIFPADFATIYNLDGISGGFNGNGQKIAIIGRSRVCTSDITNFATLSGVTINGGAAPAVTVPPGGIDPGNALCTGSAGGDQAEATLDVTRSGSIAQGANVLLVISGDNQTTDGIQVASSYVVDKTPLVANVMSISFGLCEAAAPSEASTYDSLFQQAAGEGISVFVSSGDSGAAGCDTSFAAPPATALLAAPNLICSSGYGTCVGGTEFNDTNSSQYWNPTNTSTFGSALSYIPEGAWNEPFNGSNQLQVAGTGGGVSLVIVPTPSWQLGNGVPSARAGRYMPDVSFSASGHDAYFGCLAASGGGGSAGCVVSNGSFSFVEFSGTSAAAPDMAGVAAILNQSQAGPQGHLNPKLYQLAAETSFNAFNDVTVNSSGVTNCVVTSPSLCNNTVASSTGLTGGTQGYLVNFGFDEATGLGSLNVANFLTAWSSKLVAALTAVNTSAAQVNAGVSVTFTATVSPFSGAGTPTGTVNFVMDGSQLGSGTITSGTANFATSTIPVGIHTITAVYGGDTTFAGSTSSGLSQTVGTLSQTSLQTSAAQVAQGTNVTFTATVVPTSGGTGTPTGTVAFMDGGSQIGAVTLNAGTAVFSSSILTPGTHSITAVYQGDTTFVTSTSSAVSESVVTISVGASPTSLSVAPGGGGTLSIMVTPTAGYSPTIAVACSGAPSESTCTVGMPTTSNGVQTFPVTITTTAPHKTRQITPLGIFVPMGFLLPLGGLCIVGRDKRRKLGWLGLTLILTFSTLWLSACGGSSSPTDPGTPAGTYALTVTATTSDALAIKQSVPVTLTVQ